MSDNAHDILIWHMNGATNIDLISAVTGKSHEQFNVRR
jgi:hypothetical protein